jgi:hypothetical protein
VKASAPDNPPAPMQALERIFLTIMVAGGAVPPADRVQTLPALYRERGGGGPCRVWWFSPFAWRHIRARISSMIRGSGFLVRCTRTVGLTPGTCLYER